MRAPLPRSLRGRLVVLVGVAGAILGLAGWLGSSLALQREFDTAVDDGLTERAADIGAGWRPGVTTLADPYAQVLSRSGVVLAHSVAAPDLPLVTADVLGHLPRQGVRIKGDITDLRGPVRLYVRPSHGDVVVVAAPLEALDAARARLERDVLGLLGVLLLVLLAGTWALVGAALRPVGRMTQVADSLVESSTGAAALPVPGGGDELTRLARTLNRLLARLAAVIDRERALVDDASHELRTPLSVLRGELELTLDEPDPRRQRQGVERSLRETHRLSALADDLFVLARETGGTGGPRLPLHLTSWLRETVAGVLPPAIDVSVSGPEVTMDGDTNALERVVGNILRNAAAAGARMVRITVAPSVETVTLTFEDDGTGFGAGTADHAFERFYRGQRSRPEAQLETSTSGAGLGLAIVKAVVESHGGAVGARNRTDHTGAVVELRLPLTRQRS